MMYSFKKLKIENENGILKRIPLLVKVILL